MINRYEECVGITLFKFGRVKVELWTAPKGYSIVEHSHPKEDIKLMFLFGDATFFRRNLETGKIDVADAVSFKDTGRVFSIRPVHSHWFAVSNKRLWFINFEKWQRGVKVTSAADDFKITTT